MNGLTLSTYDVLASIIAGLIAYGLHEKHEGVITVNADLEWKVQEK